MSGRSWSRAAALSVPSCPLEQESDAKGSPVISDISSNIIHTESSLQQIAFSHVFTEMELALVDTY